MMIRRPDVQASIALGVVASALLCGLLAAGPSAADEVRVLRAWAECNAESVCRVIATIRHADTGWKHYADSFEVLGEDDRVLAKRVLRHPHVHEQPFKRTLENVALPPDLETIRVRAHDTVHGVGPPSKPEKVRRPGPDPAATPQPGASESPAPD
jgi:hypothetical protein